MRAVVSVRALPRARGVLRRLALAWLVAMAATPARAQRISLESDLLFYGDNTEFSNPFREGETLLGVHGRVYVDFDLNDKVSVKGGVFGNYRFGDVLAFEQGRPVLALTVRGGSSRFVFGTLETVRRREGPGPDRTTPHGLLPPIQVEVLSFERPYEAGLQWLVDSPRLRQDAWINWQQLNTPAHRERFDAGLAGWLTVAPLLDLSYQAHIVHHGGQLFGNGPVSDSVAYSAGLRFHGRPPDFDDASIEAHGVVTRDTPDREVEPPTQVGFGVFLRGALEKAGWRGHLIVWRASDTEKVEGDANYHELRLDGTRFLNIRDYAEIGLSRVFVPADGVEIEASGRFHRIENHYGYSYRVLAVAHLGVVLRNGP